MLSSTATLSTIELLKVSPQIAEYSYERFAAWGWDDLTDNILL